MYNIPLSLPKEKNKEGGFAEKTFFEYHMYTLGRKATVRDNQIKQITFSYNSRPKVTIADRSKIHDGTIIFEITGDPVKKLYGQYWSSRKTTGEIDMKFREKKILDDYPEDLGSHPMSE